MPRLLPLLLLGLLGLASTSAFVNPTTTRAPVRARRRGLVSCKAGGGLSPANKLRQLLASPPDGGILIMPCCYDGMTARMVEMHGFPLTFMTGFGVSAARGAFLKAPLYDACHAFAQCPKTNQSPTPKPPRAPRHAAGELRGDV